MKLQPIKTRILVRFHQPESQVIKTSDSVFDSPLDGYRTRVEVLAVGPDVKSCKVGEFLLLIPKPTLLPIEKDEVLIDEAAVLGVILDDKAPEA